MLIKDKYTPIYFDDYKIHLGLINKLKKLIIDLPNLVFYGQPGTGKSTIVYSLLNELYKTNVISNDKNLKLKINNVNKEFKIKTSNYHFEIDLNKYSSLKNKIYFIPLIKLLANSREINSKCSYRLIIIKNAEHISECQNFIKNIIEKNDSLRFILITNNPNRLRNLKSLFIEIKLPILSLSEFKILLNSLDNNKHDNEKFIEKNKNIKFGNISVILLKYEIYKKNKTYVDPIFFYIEELSNYILNFNIKNIDKSRKLLYEILSKNIDFNDFIKKLYFKIIDGDYDRDKKILITNTFVKYTTRSTKAFKTIIHIEALIIELMKILY